MHAPGGRKSRRKKYIEFLIKRPLRSGQTDPLPPCIFEFVEGMIRIFLRRTQTQNTMVLICCSLAALAAAVHHLPAKKETWLFLHYFIFKIRIYKCFYLTTEEVIKIIIIRYSILFCDVTTSRPGIADRLDAALV